MRNQKNEYLIDLLEDFAVIHNIYIKEAARYKQLHNILLGAQNALHSGIYDDIDFDEFQNLIKNDLDGVYDKKI